MDAEIQAQIRNVRKFSRYARAFCVSLMVALGILSLWLLGNIVLGPSASSVRVQLGTFSIRGDQLATPEVKAWAFICVGLVFALAFKGLYHLWSLFGNFRSGGIYTRENVHHIRQLGLLALAMAVVQIVMPLASMVLLQTGVIDEASVTRESGLIFGPGHLPGFVTAGLLLLASWIMDVGRRTRDEAEELRRDAELTI